VLVPLHLLDFSELPVGRGFCELLELGVDRRVNAQPAEVDDVLSDKPLEFPRDGIDHLILGETNSALSRYTDLAASAAFASRP
jgi:hypothetical protein